MIYLSDDDMQYVLDITGLSVEDAKDEKKVFERIKNIPLPDLQILGSMFGYKWTYNGKGSCKKGYVGFYVSGHPIPTYRVAECIANNAKEHYL